MLDLDGVREINNFLVIHGDEQSPLGPAGLGHVRTQLHQEQRRRLGRGMRAPDFSQAAHFLEEPH